MTKEELKQEAEETRELKKCLKDIIYMYNSNLITKNELAFARIIARAEDLLKE